MWIFWDYCAGNGNRWGHWLQGQEKQPITEEPEGYQQSFCSHMSKLLSGTAFCFSTSSKLTLGWSLCVCNQICGKQQTPAKMGADFFLRNLFSWEWRMSETLDVSISIHPAIPNNKGGSGRKRKKSAFTKEVWVFELHLKPVSPHFPLYITEPSPALWGIDNPTL